MASDFDETNIPHGLDELDEEMNQIEEQKPSEEGDKWDEEINDLIQANKELRGKVYDISEMVAQAIVKAKQI